MVPFTVLVEFNGLYGDNSTNRLVQIHLVVSDLCSELEPLKPSVSSRHGLDSQRSAKVRGEGLGTRRPQGRD